MFPAYTGCPMPMPAATGNAYGGSPYEFRGHYGGPYMMTPYYGGAIIGADPAAPGATPTLGQRFNDWRVRETFGIQNQYLGLGGLALAGIVALTAKGIL